MRRFLILFILVPLAAVAIILSVANRPDVMLSLDPFGITRPPWTLTAPLFVFLFAAVALGVIVGGVATWLGQGKWRRIARGERAHVDELRRENQRLRERAAAAPLPRIPGVRDAA